MTTKQPQENEFTAIRVLGVKVNPMATFMLHQAIENFVASKTHALALHVNAHGLNLAYSEAWLREFMNSAHIVFCDGAGVMLGARILGYYIPQRITYADWMWNLAEFSESRGYKFFFLGSAPGVADKAATRLLARFPELNIVGTHHGFFNKSTDNLENQQVIQKINILKPDMIIVGFGMPLQEKWLMENWHKIDANIALTGGAVFDYISGELQRAPKWMTDNGLEWLGRLIIEPTRLWKRYILGNPLFLWRILKQRLGMLKLD